MARQTKQQRIDELELKVQSQFEAMKRQHENFEKLMQLCEEIRQNKNVIRLDSPEYQELKIYESMYKAEKKRSQRLIKEKDELIELVQKLKSEQKPIHNVRGAGRKQKVEPGTKEKIRELYKTGQHSMNKLSKEFNLSKGTIYNIIHELYVIVKK